jgi:ribosomal protein L12E/L44/L45/RPP1/RPP2
MNFIRAIGIRVAGSRVSLLLGTVGDANKSQVSRQADFAKVSAVAKAAGHVVGQERKDAKKIAAKERKEHKRKPSSPQRANI